MAQFNWNTIGHSKILEFLETLISYEKRPHAYLIYGREGLGKKELVQQFISALQCFQHAQSQNLEHTNYPCGACDHCQQKNHPDICLVDREFDKKTDKLKKNISIEQIRYLQSHLQKGTFLKGYNCGIIQNAHTLSDGAANSLLKILEEPPQKTMLFLIADSLTTLPKTVASRCQLIKLSNVSLDEIESYLVKKGFDQTKSQNIARLSHGRPEFAEKLISDAKRQEQYRELLHDALKLFSFYSFERLKFIDEKLKAYKGNSSQVQYVMQLIGILSSILRDMLLLKYDAPVEQRSHTLLQAELEKLLEKYSTKKIVGLIKSIRGLEKELHSNINPQLAIENLLLSL